MSQLDSPWRPVERTSFMNTLKVGHQSPIIVQHMKKSLPKSDKDPFKRGTFLLKAMQTICFLFIFISIYSITTKWVCNIQCLLQQVLFSDALQPIGLSLLTDLWHTGPTGANADVTGRGERNQGHEDQPANLLNILMIYQLDMRIMHKEVHIFGWKYMMLKANMYSPHANMRSYKCNLTNQHFCELFQSSLQTNSTKQNFQFVRSTWRYLSLDRFLASSLLTLPPSLDIDIDIDIVRWLDIDILQRSKIIQKL